MSAGMSTQCKLFRAPNASTVTIHGDESDDNIENEIFLKGVVPFQLKKVKNSSSHRAFYCLNNKCLL